ncbi:hypothetical protein [Lyngbya sp. CCY1209]|nr:hypothetical protein [Lyngbya sp. CCY1209]
MIRGKKKTSPGQIKLPWNPPDVENAEVAAVAEKFVKANCYMS